MQQGDELVVHGPVGRFNVIDYLSDKYLFLSGGVGVTPLMSMARWLFDTNSDANVVFAHSARTPRILFIAVNWIIWIPGLITSRSTPWQSV